VKEIESIGYRAALEQMPEILQLAGRDRKEVRETRAVPPTRGALAAAASRQKD